MGIFRQKHFGIASAVLLMTSLLSFSKAMAQDYVPGEVIVKLKGKGFVTSGSNFQGKMQGGLSLKSSYPDMNIHQYSLKDGDNVLSKVEELRQDPEVEYAEPNYILRKSEESLEASQAYSADDLSALAAASTYSQSYANTQVDQAWAIMKTLAQNSSRPIVAVIDTGVDYNHNVFRNSGAMWVNTGEVASNGVDDDGNGYVDDIYGYDFRNNDSSPMDDDEHGTHCAGVILGVGQDIMATTQPAAKVRIMALKFLGADGSGSTSGAIAAIYYAVRNGAQVISNSWGGAGYSQSLHDALTYAYSNKVFIASAAGNYGSNNDSSPMFPASYPVPGQTAVAATTDYDNLASFSNYGASSVHVAAPGVSVLSTIPGNSFRYMSGTSMATPFVAGLGALILREAPNFTGYQIHDLIDNTVTSVSNLSTKVFARGRVNVYSAIQAAQVSSGTASYLPAYKADARGLASSSSSSSTSAAAPKGCGTVSAGGLFGVGSDGSAPGILMVIALTLLPLIVWQVLRDRKTQVQRRKFDRFVMESDIQLKVGGRQLTAHMHTISEGGLSFDADAMLAKGGIVTIQIQSPDGKESVAVQGHIVWSEQNQAYGVQFDQAKEGVLASIRQWTANLVKAN